MKEKQSGGMRLSLFDPTGNITALVESPVAVGEQSAAAERIMSRFPKVEQVGFVRFPENEADPVELRMAGGEFCANAAMSTGALALLRRENGAADSGAWETVFLRISGLSRETQTRLRRESADSFRASVRMPPVRAITESVFPFGTQRDRLSIVRMEGICHAIVTPASAFFSLREDKAAAEEAARRICATLGAEAVGLMFLEGAAPRLRLTPLVFVPGSGTMFWENSCASGSAAVGEYLSSAAGGPVSLELEEPGGVLFVESDGRRGETRILGRTRLIGTETV